MDFEYTAKYPIEMRSNTESRQPRRKRRSDFGVARPQPSRSARPGKSYSIPRNYMSVGKFLMEARVGAGLTQKSVSLFLGYSSAQFISNYERGISIPPLKKLKILHKLTGFDVNEFVSLAMEAEKRVMQETLGSGPRGGSRLAPALPVNWR